VNERIERPKKIFDGHNVFAAAIYSKENLLNNLLGAIPSDLNRDEWVAALPKEAGWSVSCGVGEDGQNRLRHN
jgi:hypothetical protein